MAPVEDSPIRVLLVEDHQDTLRIMVKLLKAMGYGVISATSVSEVGVNWNPA